MAIYSKRPKTEFTPAPEGLHAAVCCDVIDHGILHTQFGDIPTVEIRWQLEERDEEHDRPFMVSKRFRNSLHEKAKLCMYLESWRGRKFTEEEAENFDIEKLLGVNGQVQVIREIKSGGKTYSNVQAVVPPAKNSPKLRVSEDYVRVCDREKRQDLANNPDGYEASDADVPF